jgi:hypothetical protein
LGIHHLNITDLRGAEIILLGLVQGSQKLWPSTRPGQLDLLIMGIVLLAGSRRIDCQAVAEPMLGGDIGCNDRPVHDANDILVFLICGKRRHGMT